MAYQIYTFAIMIGDKVILEIPNIFATSKQDAINNGWLANQAQPYRDGQHTAAVYR